MRTALLTMGLVAIGLLVWRLGFGKEPETPSAPGIASDALDSEEADGPGLEARPTTGARNKHVAVERNGPPDENKHAVEARHVLVGRLKGLDPELEGTARIVVRGVTAEYEEPDSTPTGVAEVDGTFRIDVTEVFATSLSVVELLVEVDHPAYMPAKTKVAIAANARRHSVEFELIAAGIIRGRIQNEAGDPVPDAEVAAFPINDAQPDRERRFLGNVEPDGTYRLRIGKQDRYVVVAAAADLQPAIQEVALAPPTEVEIPSFVLREGCSITGRVRYRGAAASGATIEVRADQPGGLRLQMGSREVVWWNGGARTGRTTATADGEGRYTIAGLTAGPHRVQLDRLRGVHTHKSFERSTRRAAQAPSDKVDFDLQGALLRIAVKSGGEPLAGRSVMVHSDSRSLHLRCGDDGRAEVLFAPRGKYHVTVWTSDLGEAESRGVAPSAGEEVVVTLELGLPKAQPRLFVTLVSSGVKIEAAGFGIYVTGGVATYPRAHWDLHVKDGRFVLDRIPPGRHILAVRPGGPWWGGQSHYLQASVEVEIPTEGEQTLLIPILLGGRLRIQATAEDGTILHADCTIRDARGEEVDARFTSRSSQGLVVSSGSLAGETINTIDPALRAGTYEVELTYHGHLPETRSVEVEVGKTKDVRVVMKPTG